MSNYQGNVGPEVYYAESIAGTALTTFSAEASLMGLYPIPQIPATYFSKVSAQASSMKLRAYLNIGTTATPTFTFSLRLLSSATTWSAGGLLLGSSNAVTGASGVTNAWAQIDVDVTLKSLAAGAATSVLSSYGTVTGTAFGTAGSIPANNVSADVSTFDASGATQYFLWLSAACSASSASNKAQLQCLKIYLEN